jgi:hypothetical protein
MLQEYMQSQMNTNKQFINNTIKSLISGVLLLLSFAVFSQNFSQGIYINQKTMRNTQLINYLIQKSKSVGINTFVIDYDGSSKRYEQNIALVKQNNIRYVARVVIFPGGGTPDQVKSMAYLQQKYQLIDQALNMGADEIQLDYIRYSSKQPPSVKNVEDIYNVIKWFKSKVAARGKPLEIDVFGIASFGRSLWIGQDIKVFGNTVDGMCPMVYPSHYQPYQNYIRRPYFIVFLSLKKFREQFNGYIPFDLHPFIEMSNYHVKQTSAEKQAYISEQLRAVADSDTDGWYAWSANNYYDNLFKVLAAKKRAAENKDVPINAAAAA